MRYGRGLRTVVGAFWGIRLCIYLGLLLYIAATAAIVITGWNNYWGWLLIFSLVSVLYSTIGGAWAVAIMDSVQFVIMLAGLLIVFPVAMRLGGGLPDMIEYFRTSAEQARHVELVPQTGPFNWVFISSIMLLGFKWSTIDQAILQRAFGASSPRVGAKGMVLSGLITTPLTFLWILPGLAVARVAAEPFARPDEAIPWLLSTQLPMIGRGLLGFVLCGLVAAQVSTITADVNSVATLFTSDVYRTLKRVEPSQRQLLFVVRASSLACGALMLVVAWMLQYDTSGAVNINLAIVGILDMPLFVVTVIYGLMWRRANWQGAVAGFVCGGLAGVVCYLFFDPATVRKSAPIISAGVALIVTPIVSLLTPHRHREQAVQIWSALHSSGGAASAEEHDTFHLIPRSLIGRLGMALIIAGFLCFMTGVLSAAFAFPYAAHLAVAGMLTVFTGGLLRVYSE